MVDLPFRRVCSRVSGAVLLLAVATNAQAVEPRPTWLDSYSQDGQCYCISTFDHDARDLMIDTPQGEFSVVEVCDRIGPGPGVADNPIYNDLQCGNGPPNSAYDEVECPGRVDLGEAGCSIIGPTWNLDVWFPAPDVEPEPEPEPEAEVAPEPIPEPGIASSEADSELTTAGSLRVSVEAEDASTRDNLWVRVDSLSADQGSNGDSDGHHANSASAGAYLELLPDERIYANDVSATGDAWQLPGAGPRADYLIDFPRAGEWEVHLRAYSTGPEDDRIHVGVDGNFGATLIIDLCNQRDEWVWSTCEQDDAPAIDVPSTGLHTVSLAGLDDGFELDRIVLAYRDDAGSASTGGDTTDQAESTEAQGGTTGADIDTSAEPELGEAITVGAGVASFDLRTLLALMLVVMLRRGALVLERVHRRAGALEP